MVRSVSGGGVDFSGLEIAMRRARESAGSGAAGAADAADVSLSSGESLGGGEAKATGSFAEMLEKGIREVNSAAKESERASLDLASGRSSNIHETMLAATKAEMGFNMLVQLRNKAIEAYQEVMRMQV